MTGKGDCRKPVLQGKDGREQTTKTTKHTKERRNVWSKVLEGQQRQRIEVLFRVFRGFRGSSSLEPGPRKAFGQATNQFSTEKTEEKDHENHETHERATERLERGVGRPTEATDRSPFFVYFVVHYLLNPGRERWLPWVIVSQGLGTQTI